MCKITQKAISLRASEGACNSMLSNFKLEKGNPPTTKTLIRWEKALAELEVEQENMRAVNCKNLDLEGI